MALWVKCADRRGYQRTEPHHVGIPPVAQRNSQRCVKALTFYTDSVIQQAVTFEFFRRHTVLSFNSENHSGSRDEVQRNIFVLLEGGTALRVTRIRAVCGSERLFQAAPDSNRHSSSQTNRHHYVATWSNGHTVLTPLHRHSTAGWRLTKSQQREARIDHSG